MPHISYSELKHWSECSWRHKLLYLDKIKISQGNEHTAFGTSVHETVENLLLEKISDPYDFFHKKFTEELIKVEISEDTELASQMRVQVEGIFELVKPALDEYFNDKK